MAKIQLNGKKVKLKVNYLFQIYEKFKLNNKKIAIEHNGRILQRTNFKKKYLKNNDKIEIVHFIGGG